VAQEPIRFWMFIAFAHGLFVPAGVLVTVRHLLTLKAAPTVASSPAAVSPSLRRARANN